jgi:DNA-binding transcriptional LysR family regulator
MLGGKKATLVDEKLKDLGQGRHIALSVNQFESLAPLMKGTDLIATIPSGFAKKLMREFNHVPCPIDLPGLNVQMVWHMRKDSDPAHKWLRHQIRTVVKETVRS